MFDHGAEINGTSKQDEVEEEEEEEKERRKLTQDHCWW